MGFLSDSHFSDEQKPAGRELAGLIQDSTNREAALERLK